MFYRVVKTGLPVTPHGLNAIAEFGEWSHSKSVTLYFEPLKGLSSSPKPSVAASVWSVYTFYYP